MSKKFFPYNRRFSHAAEIQFVQRGVESRASTDVRSCACSKVDGVNRRRSRRTGRSSWAVRVRNMARKARRSERPVLLEKAAQE